MANWPVGYEDWKHQNTELIHLLVAEQVPKEVNEQLERYIKSVKDEIASTLGKAMLELLLKKPDDTRYICTHGTTTI